jgi:hypothetical protein
VKNEVQFTSTDIISIKNIKEECSKENLISGEIKKIGMEDCYSCEMGETGVFNIFH